MLRCGVVSVGLAAVVGNYARYAARLAQSRVKDVRITLTQRADCLFTLARQKARRCIKGTRFSAPLSVCQH